MTQDHTHERYEILLVKAVDGLLTGEEQLELERHLERCPECRAELGDFRRIKEATDKMSERILKDAQIEAPREPSGVRGLLQVSFLFLLIGGVLLLGWAAIHLFGDPEVPVIVKMGTGFLGAGALLLLGYLLFVRVRGRHHDPYQEIDQ